jgi:8-oxo-dGTP pyrophosphatase MutT (NUDIX family)
VSDLRADALAVLERWPAPDPRQERLRREYVDHLRRHADGAFRSCFPDHLTAGALVVSPDASRVLLTLHRKARAWFHLGGHCEAGDATLAAAALREAREESGIEDLALDPEPVHLDRHDVRFCDPRGPVRHLDVRFLAVAPDGAAHAVSDESLDVRWWPADALPTDAADLRELVALARARLQASSSRAI